jgi:hypothetical protein
VDRRVLWICLMTGSTAGGLLPTLFGQSSLGLISILGSAMGAAVGVWAAARISEALV